MAFGSIRYSWTNRSCLSVNFSGLPRAAHAQHSGQPFPGPAIVLGMQDGQIEIELAPPSPPMCRCLHVLELGRGAGKRQIAAVKPSRRS